MKLNSPLRQYLEENITIGKLQEKLKDYDGQMYMHFDFCNYAPNGFVANLLRPRDLVVGFREDGGRTSTKMFKEQLEHVIGRQFETKGGMKFVVGVETKLWVGNCQRPHTALVGVMSNYIAPILMTRFQFAE